LFIFPSTSPTDFDFKEAMASIDKILASGARLAYPTHFGEVGDLPAAADQLRGHLRFSQALLERAVSSPLPDEQLAAFCQPEIEKRLAGEFAKGGSPFTARDREMLKLDFELNAQGLAFVAAKSRKGSTGTSH
jgi:hypothetical protein